METKVVYTWRKLGSNFQIKGKAKFDHKHDLVYHVKCQECQEDYFGEIGRRLHERICEHSGKDGTHKHCFFEDFDILWNGYTNSKFKRKISETLFIKELRPSLNSQETSVPLPLYSN